MKEKELNIDRQCHVVYSKECKKIILERLKSHYALEDINFIFEKIQYQYEYFLSQYNRRDLGVKKNFHNGKGGTYDCIMLVAYYEICKEKTSFKEIEEMCQELTVGHFKGLGFVDIDKPFFKRLMYKAFKNAEHKCAKWHDFDIHLEPYTKDKPLHYCFTRCPFADFIHQFGLEEIAGALCNVDYASMEAMNVKLVRVHTCIEGNYCDYSFYSPNNPYVKEHPTYRDEQGFIRNK